MIVQLGDEVKDTVSNFTGVAVARHEYLNGCVRISVQPEVKKDGNLPDTQTFDEPQLEIKKTGKVSIGSRLTGGPEKYMPAARPAGWIRTLYQVARKTAMKPHIKQPRDYPSYLEQDVPPPAGPNWPALIGIVIGLAMMAAALWPNIGMSS